MLGSLATVDDVKLYGGVASTNTKYDAILPRMLLDASNRIRAYTGRTFASLTETRRLDWEPSGIYQTGPIRDVTAVRVDGVALTAGQYTAYPDRIELHSAGPYYVPNLGYVRYIGNTGARFGGGNLAVEIAATWGDAAVPEVIRDLAAVTAWRLVKMWEGRWQVQAGTSELGETQFARVWTPDDYAVLKRYKSGGDPVGFGAV